MRFTLILLSVLLIAATQGQLCDKDADCTTSGQCCMVTVSTVAGVSSTSKMCYKKTDIKAFYELAKEASSKTTTSTISASATFSCADGSEKYTISSNANLINFTFLSLVMMIVYLYL